MASQLKHIAKVLGLVMLACISIALAILLARNVLTPFMTLAFDLAPAEESLVRRLAILVALPMAYWLFVRYVEKRPVEELRLKASIPVLGILFGVLSIGLPICVLHLIGAYKLSPAQFSSELPFIALFIFVAALMEEVFFRAIIFRLFLRHFGAMVAFLFPAVLFSSLHLFNDNWSGLPVMISGFLLAILWSLVFLWSNNLWTVACHHAFWNFTIFATGVPLTGNTEWQVSAPMRTELLWSELWTGGAAGPEASILVLVTISFGCLVWLSLCTKKGLFKSEVNTI